MLEIIKAVIYGLIQGITEWLPVSSTGHLLLAEKLIPFEGLSEGFFDMFDVVIQLGSIMAVVILFWNKIWPFTFPSEKADKSDKNIAFNFVKVDKMVMWIKIAVSCIPAVIIGLLFDDILNELFYRYEVIALALIIFGIAFIVVENWNKGRKPKVTSISQITFQAAFFIGIFQVIAAVFPGTSRSGATIIGALLLGISRKVAAEYTFFLAIPVMFGASLLKVIKYGVHFTALETAVVLTGMFVAFMVSLFVLKFLMNYIKKHDFKVFGWYRIVLGVIVLIYFGLIV